MSNVQAQESGFSFRTLLMPGKVSASHAEFEAECSNCHGEDDKLNAQLCLDCHNQDIAVDISNEVGFHGRISQQTVSECSNCHAEHLGREADILGLDRDTFDHSLTDFQLEGQHQQTSCSSCHDSGSSFRDAPTACNDCHQQDDMHLGNLGQECQSCHTPASWQQQQFNHDDTGFVLRGAHVEQSCNACHPDQKYQQTPTQCIDCHGLNDVHLGKNGQQCQSCHSETRWDQIAFNHNQDTDFALLNSHASLECNACHLGSVFDQTLGDQCIDCHAKDDQHSGRLGSQCQDCHSTSSWASNNFDHSDTDFPLIGTHQQTDCNSCHQPGASPALQSTACISCHADDDAHQGEQGRSCQSCHNPSGWQVEVRFNHDLSNFPLMGMHAITSCDSCHASSQFKQASIACIDCHASDDYHQLALGENCADCHNPNGWDLWVFDHNSQTDFALNGVHAELGCTDCHNTPAVNGQIANDSECASCHRKDDVHNRQFGQSCDRCHTTTSFKDIRVR